MQIPRVGSVDTATSRADVHVEAGGFPSGVVGWDLTRHYSGEENSFLGFVSLHITRQAGMRGRVGVWYKILGGQSDFVSTTAPVLLEDGQAFVDIDIGILDDNLPELDEVFDIVLINPSGGVRIDPLRSITTITILQSDDPNGVVAVAAGSQSVSVAEPVAGAAQNVTITLIRTAGAIGDVTVRWALVNLDGQQDVSPSGGNVTIVSDRICLGGHPFELPPLLPPPLPCCCSVDVDMLFSQPILFGFLLLPKLSTFAQPISLSKTCTCALLPPLLARRRAVGLNQPRCGPG